MANPPRTQRTPKKPAPDGLDATTRDTLRGFLQDIRSLPNEAAKSHRFIGLVSELFPGTSAGREIAAGVEKIVRIETEDRRKTGRIDAYYGNVVIEFENSLKATEAQAKRQLCEYTAGLWAEEGKPPRPLVCVASDGVTWKTFLPRLKPDAKGKPKPTDIGLEPLRTLVVSEETLKDFWIWLTSLLFGGGRRSPSAARFRVDFGATSPAFADAIDALQLAWAAAKSRPEARLALETWQKYLTVTYGQLGNGTRRAELEALFLKHTYLASTARFLIWAALSRGRTTQGLREVAKDVLSGRFFQAQGIENLVEDDFFQWVRRREAEPHLAPVWERMLTQMLTYDLERLDQDVLKGVYQELVDPKDRHDLGEYYTPEWLCERIVDELLPARGFVSVIDPTCGSGSFLRAAVAHLLRANTAGDGQLHSILENVAGIDIHPLAVIISKATYLLAIAPLVKAAKRPIQIPVYLADSLFLPSEVRQLRLGEVPGYEIRFGGDRAVSIPEDLVKEPELFDPAVTACSKVAVDLAASGKETEASLRAYLRRSIPDLAAREDFPTVVPALWRFTQEMADLIRKQRNSIWAFIIRNAYRPAMFRGRFDFVVGNPPWLSYRYIADPEYQAEVKKRAVDEYKVAPKSQKLVTQMELATVFLAHTLTTFGRASAKLGFVMPRSILSADQHQNFRDGSFTAPIRIDRYWDLMDVRPLFNVPSCVVFATRGHHGVAKPLPAVEWHGKLSHRDESWAEARPQLTSEDRTAQLIIRGSRSAFSTAGGSTTPSQASPYAKSFRQGATIVPRSFYFVRVRDLRGKVDPERVYWAETDPEQAESAKPPYNDVHFSGSVEGRFLFSTALAKHLLPFVLLDPPAVVLPIVAEGDTITLRPAANLRSDGYREVAKWMDHAEKVWKAKRKGKAERQSVYARLDYNRELTHQNTRARFLVVYNASGTNLCGASLDREALAEPFVVDHKLYWMACRSQAEADYLAAILNAPAINEAIKPFQSMGLMGERDVHKKVLDLPIPRFDRRNADHEALAMMGARARATAATAAKSGSLPSSLARRRAAIRAAVESTLREIDPLVRELLR